MARAKLSDLEKQEIVRLYRETDASTTRLADQFNISTSTISRLLRAEIAPEEYARISTSRRGGRSVEEVQTTLGIDVLAPDPSTATDEDFPLEIGEAIVAAAETDPLTPVVPVADLEPEAPTADWSATSVVDSPEVDSPEVDLPAADVELEVAVDSSIDLEVEAPATVALDLQPAEVETEALPVEAELETQPAEAELEALSVEAELEALTTEPEPDVLPVEAEPVQVTAEIEPEVEVLPTPAAELVAADDGAAIQAAASEVTDARRRRRRSAPPVSEVVPVAEPEPTVAEVAPPIVAPAPEPVLEVVIPPIAEPIVPVLDEPLPTVADLPVEPQRSRILKKSDSSRTPPPLPPETARPLPEVPAEVVPAQFAEIEAELANIPGSFSSEEFDDEDDFEDEEFEEGVVALDEELTGTVTSSVPIEVLPFTEAEFPRICWVVVDRASELMTRPLRDFNNIGTIPDTEREEITLPIFENHRVARGYSGHYNRPLRLPAHLLTSTRPYLLRKGITRLLVGKQVYSLSVAGEVLEAVDLHDEE